MDMGKSKHWPTYWYQGHAFSENEVLKVRMKNISEPVDFIELNLNDRIIQLIVDETNQYATYHMTGNPEQANNSFVGMWRPVDCKKNENISWFVHSLRHFEKTKYKDVLVSRGPYFNTCILQNYDSKLISIDTKIYKRCIQKICPFLDLSWEVFQKTYQPGHNLSVDESLTGFNNYHKIAVHGHACVPKFWHTWCTWANTKKHMSDIIPFTFWFVL